MFTGSMVAIVTPFKNGKIDEAAFRKLIERQIANGTSAIIPCGTTGESATLTHEEHATVIKITVDQVKGRIKVLAGAGSNATHEAIKLHEEAKKIGADGALHITPYYNKPTQEGLFQHFKVISQTNDLPIILYNVPGRTGVNMVPDTVTRLAELKNIIGIKEASGSLDQVAELIKKTPKNFLVLSGEDDQTFLMYQLGAKGAISVTANVVPKECAKEWELFKSGKIEEASQQHNKLSPLHKAMFYETNPIPVKAALAMMGLISEEYRLPLVPLSEANRKKLKDVLKEYELI